MCIGGTADIVGYARQKGIPVAMLWPRVLCASKARVVDRAQRPLRLLGRRLLSDHPDRLQGLELKAGPGLQLGEALLFAPPHGPPCSLPVATTPAGRKPG